MTRQKVKILQIIFPQCLFVAVSRFVEVRSPVARLRRRGTRHGRGILFEFQKVTWIINYEEVRRFLVEFY